MSVSLSTSSSYIRVVSSPRAQQRNMQTLSIFNRSTSGQLMPAAGNSRGTCSTISRSYLRVSLSTTATPFLIDLFLDSLNPSLFAPLFLCAYLSLPSSIYIYIHICTLRSSFYDWITFLIFYLCCFTVIWWYTEWVQEREEDKWIFLQRHTFDLK